MSDQDQSFIQGYAPVVGVTERIAIAVTKEQARELMLKMRRGDYGVKGILKPIQDSILAKWPDL